MDTHDWRSQLLPQIRQIKVDKITDKLKFYQARGGGGGGELVEVQKIARCYEQKTYAGAASEEDYLRKISSMILSIRKKYWRSLLQPDCRQRIINKMLETLRTHIPYSGQEGLDELRKIAAKFEEKIYYAATSKRDYLRKMSLKMLTMKASCQTTIENSMPSKFGYNGDGPSDTGRWSIRKRKQSPEEGWVKVTVDGAYSRATDRCACGGIICNSSGTFIRGFFHPIDGDELSAEVWGCLLGLKIAWAMGFRKVWLETNSTRCLDLLSHEQGAHHRDSGILDEVKKMLHMEWESKVTYVPRSSNSAANYLAKKGLDSRRGLHEIHTPSEALEVSLSKDCNECNIPIGIS